MNEQSNKENAVYLILNVTVKVDRSIADAWLLWLKQEYIPLVMQTNCFVSVQTVRLLEVDDADGPTYAVQYGAESKADYLRYNELHAARLQKISFDKWGERFIAFRSLMEVI